MGHRLPTEIQPGELRHRVQIVTPSGVQDSSGGISQDPSQWTVLRTCWASIEAWTGSSSLAAGSFMSESSHWIVIRNPRTFLVTAKMLVWWNKRTFQIDAVLNPTEQNKLLVIVATEVNDSSQEIVTPVAP